MGGRERRGIEERERGRISWREVERKEWRKGSEVGRKEGGT